MSSTAPKVSIGLPVYNGENHIRECLDSLLGQTFEDFELIILDNASTDATQDICLIYEAMDPRIKYYRQNKNVGAASNFNHAFELANGRYFKWAAHDDICAPEFLDACVRVLDEDDSIVLAFTGTELINDDGSRVIFDETKNAYVDSGGRTWVIYFDTDLNSNDSSVRFRSMLFRSILCHEVFGLIRSDAIRASSLIGDYYGSDKVLLAELCLQGRFTQIQEALFLRRCHPGQSSRQPLIEKEKWISGKEPGRIVFPQIRVLQGYMHAISKYGKRPADKLREYIHLLRYGFSLEKIRRLNVARKNSYLRIYKPRGVSVNSE